MTEKTEGYKTLTLSEAAAYDHEHKLKDKHTGWRKVSDDRRARGISRKERRKQRAS